MCVRGRVGAGGEHALHHLSMGGEHARQHRSSKDILEAEKGID